MLKLGKELEKGVRIILRESWHEKAMTFSKNKKIPYEFILTDIVKQDKERYYICEDESKKHKIALTEFAIKYLFADEVPDSNIGFSFKDYLPLENTYLLLTNNKNPSNIIPAILKVEMEMVEIAEESYNVLCLVLDYTNGKGFSDIRHFAEGNQKSTWKFVYHQDEAYMTEYEMQFKDTIIHKSYVIKSAEKLARYLEKEGAVNHAKLLREKAIVHDDSKISCEDEMCALARIIKDKSTLKDASKQLSPIKKDAIELHYKHNTHHPEHFQTPIDMSRIDIMEMCCDWHARSTQYQTNFLEYVEKQQELRFHFSDWMFAEIMHYCKILATENL